MSLRNFAAEAVAIAQDQSSILPEVEHVKVLAAQMESVLNEKRLLEELLVAAMVDTGQNQLYFPAGDLDRVRKHRLMLTVTRNPKNAPGAVLVELTRVPAALPVGAGKARLN